MLTESEKPLTRADKIERIITHIMDGLSLRKAVERESVGLRTFHDWISSDREAALRYARARELLMDAEVDEAKELADGDGDPAKVRNQVDIRKWRAQRLNAKTYGDRVDLNVTQTLDISTTLQEAKARLLRPVRDQLGVSDAQVIDLPRLEPAGARDIGSRDKPKGDEVPDIFS